MGAGPRSGRRLEPRSRVPVAGEAESWLGEFYPGLVDAGVQAVSLYEADRLVYGPMSLEPGRRLTGANAP